jgi:hypothetical protein
MPDDRHGSVAGIGRYVSTAKRLRLRLHKIAAVSFG